MTKTALRTALLTEFEWVENVAQWKLLREWGGASGNAWSTYSILCVKESGSYIARKHELTCHVFDDGGASEEARLINAIKDAVFRNEMVEYMSPYLAQAISVYEPNALFRMPHAVETRSGDSVAFTVSGKVIEIAHTAHGVNQGDAVTIRFNTGSPDIIGNYICQNVPDVDSFRLHADIEDGSGNCFYVSGATFEDVFVVAHKSAINGNIIWQKTAYGSGY